jgi:hypothetical protein
MADEKLQREELPTECEQCAEGFNPIQLTDGTWAHEFSRPDPLPDNPNHRFAWMEPCAGKASLTQK